VSTITIQLIDVEADQPHILLCF